MPIIKHTCASKFQDERYGSGNRVMNKCKAAGVFRCTVCGKEYSKGVATKDKK
jgi:hypothetical protein